MSYVYVVEAENGLIKIGCGRRPEERLSSIRTHTPLLTRLIAKWPGSSEDERALHKRFGAQKHHCEWFRIDGPVLDFVVEVRGRGIGQIHAWSELQLFSPSERQVRAKASHAGKMKQMWAEPEARRKWLIALAAARETRKRFGPNYWEQPDYSLDRFLEIRDQVAARFDAPPHPAPAEAAA